MLDPCAEFGPIDIYLFDQIIKRRIVPGMRVLDAGCGSGRNLVHFLRSGYEVLGVDASPEAIASVRDLARRIDPALDAETLADRFRLERIESSTFGEEIADLVISNAVLHFAPDDESFESMLRGSWTRVRRGGLFFCRLTTQHGVESLARRTDGRRHRLPDGSDRYLLSYEELREWTDRLGGELLEPIKSTLVERDRSMTTWVLRRR